MTFASTPFPLITILTLLAIVAIFAMKYWSLSRRTNLQEADDAAYRGLAEKSVQAQSTGAAALAALQVDIADVKRRLASVEAVLKDVG